MDQRSVQAFSCLPLQPHPQPPLELLSVPLMDQLSLPFRPHTCFSLFKEKLPLSSPFSAFTVDRIVEKERERQVEVKSDQSVLSLPFKLLLGLQQTQGWRWYLTPRCLHCLKSWGWRIFQARTRVFPGVSSSAPLPGPQSLSFLNLSYMSRLWETVSRTWPGSPYLLPQSWLLISPYLLPQSVQTCWNYASSGRDQAHLCILGVFIVMGA